LNADAAAVARALREVAPSLPPYALAAKAEEACAAFARSAVAHRG
jgi:hypothetical protein